MELHPYNSSLIVDMHIIHNNIHSILHALPEGTQVIPVLKCNAYGLGMLPVARALAQYPAIRCAAVAQAAEGLQLRHGGWRREILVLGGMIPDHFSAAVSADLTITASRPGMLGQLAACARQAGHAVRIQLKLETGLNRVGILPGPELDKWIQELRAAEPWVRLTGVYSHFADAEGRDFRRIALQQKEFRRGVRQLLNCGIHPGLLHMSNSAASEWLSMPGTQAVRLGRRLYWDSPDHPTGTIQEAVSLRSVITHLHHLPAGARLGYGEGYRLEHETTVATIGIGYGDGLNRSLAACHAPVMVRGQRVPLLICCMDQSFLDIGNLPCRVGDSVTLFGQDELGRILPGQEIAALISDEACGLTAALSPRVARIYMPSASLSRISLRNDAG